jgi:hypothetical protein
MRDSHHGGSGEGTMEMSEGDSERSRIVKILKERGKIAELPREHGGGL